MLHLLPSVLSRKINTFFSLRRIFLGELLFFVFCCHVVLFGLCILFSSLHVQQEQFSISLHQTGQTYVLMPLSKKISDFQKQHKKSDAGSYKKSKIIDYETYQKHKKVKKQKKQVVKKNTEKLSAVKKTVSPEKVLTQAQMVDVVALQESAARVETLPVKALPQKNASLRLQTVQKPQKKIKMKNLDKAEKNMSLLKAEKNMSLLAEKRAKLKKTTKELAVQPVKQPTKEMVAAAEIALVEVTPIVETPIVETPIQQSEVLVEPGVVEAIMTDQITEPHVERESDVSAGMLATEEHDEHLDNDIDLENVVFLGQEQFDNSVVASKLKQAVEKCWNPPVGIKAGTSCQMRVHVGAQGKADDVKVLHSSKILMYDLPARKALFAMQYPKEVWNKTIMIALGV